VKNETRLKSKDKGLACFAWRGTKKAKKGKAVVYIAGRDVIT